MTPEELENLKRLSILEQERTERLAESNRELSEANATLRAEVAQLTEQLSGAARVLITVERERDEARQGLEKGQAAARKFSMAHYYASGEDQNASVDPQEWAEFDAAFGMENIEV